jgi:SAM-dependent methyltransferase
MPPLTTTSFEDFFRSIADIPVSERPMQMQALATLGQYRRAYDLVPRHLGEAREVLDWGCGNGHFSRALLDNGLDVTGYSYEGPPRFVDGSERFHFVAGTAGEPCALPFADARFDAVFSIGVLEHVHELGGDQRRSMAEVLRVLKPGGRFFIFHLPNRGSWIETAVRTSNALGLTANKHHHSLLFSRATFGALLDGHNAQIVAEGRYNLVPRNSLRRLPKWLRDGRGFCGLLNALDDALGAVLPMFAQNWYFIVEKGRGPASTP